MRRGVSRPLTVAMVLVGTALLLSGCSSGDSSAQPTPTKSMTSGPPATTTASPTQSIARPTLPAEAKAATVEGAAAFIRHYFAAVNFAYSTGDLGPVKSLRAADCTACATLEQRIEDAYSSEAHIKGAHIVVEEVTPTPGDYSKGADVRAVLRQDAGKVLTGEGDVVEDIPAESERLGRFVLDWQGNWILVQWGSNDAS